MRAARPGSSGDTMRPTMAHAELDAELVAQVGRLGGAFQGMSSRSPEEALEFLPEAEPIGIAGCSAARSGILAYP